MISLSSGIIVLSGIIEIRVGGRKELWLFHRKGEGINNRHLAPENREESLRIRQQCVTLAQALLS